MKNQILNGIISMKFFSELMIIRNIYVVYTYK